MKLRPLRHRINYFSSEIPKGYYLVSKGKIKEYDLIFSDMCWSNARYSIDDFIELYPGWKLARKIK